MDCSERGTSVSPPASRGVLAGGAVGWACAAASSRAMAALTGVRRRRTRRRRRRTRRADRRAGRGPGSRASTVSTSALSGTGSRAGGDRRAPTRARRSRQQRGGALLGGDEVHRRRAAAARRRPARARLTERERSGERGGDRRGRGDDRTLVPPWVSATRCRGAREAGLTRARRLIQWRDRAGISPASRSSANPALYRRRHAGRLTEPGHSGSREPGWPGRVGRMRVDAASAIRGRSWRIRQRSC